MPCEASAVAASGSVTMSAAAVVPFSTIMRAPVSAEAFHAPSSAPMRRYTWSNASSQSWKLA